MKSIHLLNNMTNGQLAETTSSYVSVGTFTQSNHENLIGATNDADAMRLFLNKAGARSNETLRRYERDIFRFTAYLYLELGIGYQQVRLTHLYNYIHFIQHLPKQWLQPGIVANDPKRILFKAPIKPGKSTDQVIDVLSTFFSFLDRSRYVMGNPASAMVRSGEKLARGHGVVRFFYRQEWLFIRDCLENMPEKSEKQRWEKARTRYMIAITYGLGLRESELTKHSCADIYPDDEGGFYLSVVGKGRKRRQVPINQHLQQTIMQFRQQHDLDGLHGDDFPLAPRKRREDGRLINLSSRGLRYWWQRFINYCVAQAEDNMANRLSNIPFHTLRHTALTHLAQRMDIEDLAIFAGHDSIHTTSQYYHAEAERLKSQAQNHYF